MSETAAVPLARGQVAAPEPATGNPLLTLAIGVVVVGALYVGRDVFLPITLAVLLSFIVAPIVSVLKKLRLPRVAAVFAAMFLALAVILGVGATMGMEVASLGPDLPVLEAGLQQKAQFLRGSVGGAMDSLQQRVERQFERPASPAPARPTRAVSGTAQNPVSVRVQPAAPTPIGLAEQILGPVLAPLGTTVLVLILSVFVLLQQDDLRDRMIRLFGSNDLHRTTLALNDGAKRLSRYFLAQLCINAVFGMVIAAGLFAIGVPSPALWGLLATLLRFVPYVGVPVAAVVPLVLAAATEPGWGRVAWTAGLYFGSEALTGQIVEPLAYGRSTGLSPASVMIAAIFWTWLWGPIGLLLSTPLTLCLVVLGRHVKRLEFLAVLLGDRPALTPTESLYQRLLADDADEAATQAETLLRDRPLAAYYETVVLPSLLMAASDVARGVLQRPLQLRMRDAVCELVSDLEPHDDAPPPAREAEPAAAEAAVETSAIARLPAADRQAPPPEHLPPDWSVLCVGGRTPLDDAAAALLAQLLRKHGLSARHEPHESVGRDRISALEARGIGAVCVAYLEPTGTPAHLRFLLRRLRGRLPSARLILGLWGAAEAASPERDLRHIVGADAIAGSLREATIMSLEAADAAIVEMGEPAPAEAVSA